MALGENSGLMDLSITDSTLWARKKGLDASDGRMDLAIAGNGPKTKFMVAALTSGRITDSMLVNLQTARSTDWEDTFGQTAELMKVNT